MSTATLKLIIAILTPIFGAVIWVQEARALTVNYDIQDKMYEWSSREVVSDQLEELLSIIVTNSDNTTTGRTLDVQGHLGITLNCQVSLDQLATDGFTIIQ